MDETRRKLVVDPLYNETAATVVQYLETLYCDDEKGTRSEENTEQEQVSFNSFGTEHASFLLQSKK